MAAQEVGARCAPASMTGCRATTPRPRCGCRKPSVAKTPRAASSTSRKTPVITALTRTFRIEITVTMAVATRATGRAGRFGTTTPRYSARPSAVTAWPSAPPKMFKPSAMKPKDGPSVWPIIEYSPPVSGKADDSSA